MDDRLATIDMARKVGGLLCPFSWRGSWVPIQQNVAWADAYLRIKWHPDLSNRLATIRQRYRQERQTDRQTDRATVQ